MAEISIGSVLGGYRVEGVAGEGGMGRVYRATQIGLGRQVALKLIMPELAMEPDFRERFARESRLTAAIEHPNVIPVYEAGEADGHLFIAMRWVEGTDLRSVILREGAVGADRAVAIVEQVAAALDAAHAGGLVHRDVKPANVMLTTAHGREHVYLMDFGLTKRTASVGGLTRTGAFVGTPDYMAPEQIKGERTDARADVYALGCLLFNVLSGRPPFDRDTEVAKMYAQLHDPPPSVVRMVPGTPPELDAVISRALAKQADERYPSAGDLGNAARAALVGAEPVAPERSLATGPAAPVFPPTELAEPDATAASPPPVAEPDVTAASPPPVAEPDATAASPPPVASSPPPAEPPAASAPPPPASAPPRQPERSRSAWPIAFAAALIVAVVGGLAAAGVFSGGGGGGGGGDDKAADTGGDGQSGGGAPRVVKNIPAGQGPDGIAVDGKRVWVSNSRGNALVRIDSDINQPAGQPIAVGTNPDEVEANGGVVWVANTDDGTVSRVEGDSQPQSFTVGAGPEGLSLGHGFLWVANGDGDSVSRIDLSSGEVLPPIAVGSKPIGIFAGKRFVWVTNSFDGSVSRIDPATGEVVGTTEDVGRNIRSVTEALGFVWVSSAVDGGTVVRLDPQTGEIVGNPIQAGDRPKEMAASNGLLWVVNERSNDVLRIDPKLARVVGKPIKVGEFPVGIAAGVGALWVSNNRSNTVTRIDPGGS
jgi:serine/threonine protein kinase/DNA-binding beta-propeller fold protein YncE